MQAAQYKKFLRWFRQQRNATGHQGHDIVRDLPGVDAGGVPLPFAAQDIEREQTVRVKGFEKLGRKKGVALGF